MYININPQEVHELLSESKIHYLFFSRFVNLSIISNCETVHIFIYKQKNNLVITFNNKFHLLQKKFFIHLQFSSSSSIANNY